VSTPRLVVPVDDLVRSFRLDPKFRACIEAVRELPAEPPRYAPWPQDLDPRVRTAAAERGITVPFVHQAEAIERALVGPERAVVVATGTASGKSLCYTLPIAHAALAEPGARALLLFPTKALAHDQLAALQGWDAQLGGVLRPAAYDGDTPSGARAGIRRSAHALVTNPEMLHVGILPHHAAWAPFLRQLRWVVVDEAHVYRGVFGSHVANVIRRLRRVCRFHGADPRFVLASATIANPGELAQRLTGERTSVVDDDGAPRGRRVFAFYNPPLVEPALGIRRSVVLEAERVARHFLAGNVQTIVFARTRQAAELIVRYLGEARDDAPEGAPPVRGYRGGYTASERRATEAALRDGALRGVVATNALELGIDIGDLDACVMAGYPGSIASTWQQAGRAGRRATTSAAVFVAGPSPLDQFIVRRPEFVLGRSPESARIDPDNLLILLDHVRCAAFELPFDADEAARPFGEPPQPVATDVQAPSDAALQPIDAALGPIDATDVPAVAIDGPVDGARGPTLAADDRPDAAEGAADAFGPPTVAQLLAVLEAQGVVREVGGTWYWLADAYPAQAVGLRAVGGDGVAIVRPDAGQADGWRVLGTVDRSRAPTTVHEGAVYLHDGAAFRIAALDWDAGRATALPTDGATYTRAASSVSLRVLDVRATRPAKGATCHHGELEVTTRASRYREVAFRTHETVGWGRIDLPPHVSVSGGYWFTLDDATIEALRELGTWQHDPLADRGASWPAQRQLARERDGFACRLCGAPEPPGRQHDVHHIRPYRAFAGGRPPAGRGAQAPDGANDLDNLITLCQSCHRAAERALGLHGGLTGVGYALQHMAPLLLMCDAGDLGVSAESHAPWTRRPTVAVYERAAGGVGFGPALFEAHEDLLAASRDLVAGCPCPAGCPACVGPAEGDDAAKAHALAVLEALAG